MCKPTPICDDCELPIMYVPQSGFTQKGYWAHREPNDWCKYIRQGNVRLTKPKVFVF